MGKRRDASRRIHRLAPHDDVERELAFHLAMREQELVDQGWEVAAAREEARRVFGNYRAIETECAEIAVRHRRSSGRSRMLSELVQDLRYAGRWLAREPGFGMLAVLTLALGIGANTAAFGIVNGVLLSPLPYPSAERLVSVHEVSERGTEMPVAWPNFADLQERARQVELAAHSQAYEATVLGGAEPTRPRVAGVSSAFFRVMGVAPLLGRAFVQEELVPGGRAAVVVGETFWREQLNGERDLSKLVVSVLGQNAHVVGVMPRGFSWPTGAQLWYPVEPQAAQLWSRTAHNFGVTGRLREGATAGAAQTELTGIIADIRARTTDVNAFAMSVQNLREHYVGGTRQALLILLAASGFVLLVACTNLASALLSRAARRSRELAIRASLGAPRLRLVRQLLTESLLLAVLGAVAGVLLAHVLIDVARHVAPAAVPRMHEVSLDGRVLAFTTLVAVATALIFGTVPALRATSAQPNSTLGGTGRGTRSPRERRAWSVLVSVEVALALMLLVGAGLLVRSFAQVMQVDPGFDPQRVLSVTLSLPESKYAGEARVAYYDRLIAEIGALPGVEGVSMTRGLPVAGSDPRGMFDIEGGEEGEGSAHYRVAGPGFFEAMRTPLLRGRAFTEADRAGAPPVMVINEALATTYFADRDPLGARIMTGGMDLQGADVYVTVVGIVGDVRHASLTSPPAPAYYLPYAQRWDRIGDGALVIRSAALSGSFAAAVRDRIRAIDNDVAFDVRPLNSRIGDSLADRRFMLLVLGTFAAVALVLAGVGIYAVVSTAVADRTREIGIRVALGAEKSKVLRLVSASTLGSVGAGMAGGLIGSALLTRLIASLLFEVGTVDPLTFGAVALLLFATAWAAVLVPARRALRVNPVTALKVE